jgi:ribosomal protein S18 acetylase RimI-like enzyme
MSWGLGFYIADKRVYILAPLAIGCFVCLFGYSIESLGAPAWAVVAGPVPLDLLLLWYVLRKPRKMLVAYLAAWAGERLRSAEFAEISAVCTHPEFRGRGYARDLTTFLAAQILAAGKTPFLHVRSENGAKVVYQKIGFRLRAAISLTVISLR